MIGRQDDSAGPIYPKSLFESACYKLGLDFEKILVVQLSHCCLFIVHRQTVQCCTKKSSQNISFFVIQQKPAHDQVQKYTVLMMNTQAVMMIVVILANLLLLLTGLKRCEYFLDFRKSRKPYFLFRPSVSTDEIAEKAAGFGESK